jgi:cystathionine beta-lyase/cystathionine gamma-synthase
MHDDEIKEFQRHIAERSERLRARVMTDEGHAYSEKTHLIHGRNQSARWDYRHHVVPPQGSSVTYRLDTSSRGAQGFQEFGQGHQERRPPIYIYDRLDEPTRGMLEENLAYAERGEMAVAYASGMAAISGAVCCLAGQGQEILSHHLLYGCTFSLFTNWLPRFGIKARGLDLRDLDLLARSIHETTRVVYFETPVNPNLEQIDITAVAAVVAEANKNRPPEAAIRVVVDNTFATPYCQRPLELGADVVVASLTKSLGGFGTDLGGVVVGPRWLEPTLMSFRKDFGGVLSAKSAWPILVYGLPTLAVRIRQQQQTAMRVARYLEQSPFVERVYYPGLDSFPQRDLALRQLRDYEGEFAPGTLIYFVIANNDGKKGQEFIDHVADHAYSITMAVSLGQVKTLIEHPYSMTHSALTATHEAKSLVDPGGVRLSIGLEKGDDLIYDFEQAFAQVFGS